MAERNREYFREDNFFNIPESGDIFPLKFICTEFSKYGANLSAENYVTEGSRFIRTSDIDDNGKLSAEGVYIDEQLVEEYKLKEGDFLISRSGTLGRGYLYNVKDGLCSYAGYLVKYSLNRNIANPKFLFYCTKTDQFNRWLNYSVIEATIGNINGEKYANLPLPIPSLKQQNKIVGYLDKEVAKIDALIEKKTQLITVLEEKKKAVINQAVTKGLVPNVSMKDSGIEWLGEIPKHWEVVKLKYLSKGIETGSTPNGYDIPLNDDENVYNWFTPGDFEEDYNKVYESKRKLSYEVIENTGTRLYDPNSVMFVGIGATLGKVAVTDSKFYTNQQLNIIELKDNVNKFFIAFSLSAFINVSKMIANSATLPILNQQKLGDIQIPIPKLEEQNLLVEHLEKICDNHSNVVSKISNSIELLKEKRTAIISAAVNGELNASLS